MIEFNKIVAPTDFSEPSHTGLDAAVDLARQHSAEMILVNVVAPLTYIPASTAPSALGLPEILKDIQAEAKTSLRKLIDEKVGDGIRSKGVVVIGDAAEQIVTLAESENADVIVMATHGHSGWQRLISGSVAEKVVRRASLPVLTINAPNMIGEPEAG